MRAQAPPHRIFVSRVVPDVQFACVYQSRKAQTRSSTRLGTQPSAPASVSPHHNVIPRDPSVRLRVLTGEAYGVAYRKYFEERLPDHGYPCRYTVHLVDSPDTVRPPAYDGFPLNNDGFRLKIWCTQAASYEFYSVGLLQQALPSNASL